MARKNIFSGIALLLFCAVGFISTSQLEAGGEHVQYGPEFFPRMFLTVLAVGACILIVKGIFVLKTSGGGEVKIPEEKHWFRFAYLGKMLLLGFLIGLYIFLFNYTGFIVSTVCFLVAAQLLYGRRRYISIFSVAVLGAVLTYLILAILFEVPLPLMFID